MFPQFTLAVDPGAWQTTLAASASLQMPSGKTHDAITIALAVPVFAAAYSAAGPTAAAISTASFLFGGLMFGPDLDTVSVQYSRWLFLRPLWFPYRKAFKHRSRWSHGLIFGTLIRVVYFLGAMTLLAYLGFMVKVAATGGQMPEMSVFLDAWRQIGAASRSYLETNMPGAIFWGMWAGAASRTFTDLAGTFIKTGRVSEYL